MIKAIFLITMISVLCLSMLSSSANFVYADDYPEKITDENSLVKDAISEYFSEKYQIFTKLSTNEFGESYSEVNMENHFSEYDRLNIEMKHAQLYDLSYKEYDFTLNFEQSNLIHPA